MCISSNHTKNMTVAELTKALSAFPPEMPILFSRDAEGNTLHVKADVIETDGVWEDNEDLLAVVIYPRNSAEDIS